MIVFLLAALAAFSACSKDGAVSADSTATESTVSREESRVLTEEQQLVTDAMALVNIEKLLGYSAHADFSSAGYSVAINDMRLSSDDDFTAVLSLEFTRKSSGEVTLFDNLSVKLDYDIDHLRSYPDNLYTEGVAAGVCGDEIYIADLDRLRFFDADTLERSSASVFFENDPDHNVIFYNVIKNDGTYIIACRSGGEDVILMTSGQGGVYEFDLNLKDKDSYVPFKLVMSLREGYPAHIMFGDLYCYDADKQALYSVRNRIEGENNGEVFYFEKWQSLSTTGSDCYQLTAYKNGKLQTDIFEDLEINQVFGIDQQTNEFGTNVTMTFEEEGRRVILHCPDSQATVTLDRDTDTGTVQYSPDARQIKTANAIYSSDQRYTIYRGAAVGGGDYYAYQMILHDSSGSKYSYIDVVGGMYGGGEDIGFFTNNDIYIFSHTDFIVYEAGMPTNEPKFVLSRNFPLGEINQGDVYARYIFAARRDPVTSEYIVIYADFPQFEHVGDLTVDTNNLVLQPTYKIGMLDSSGVLQSSIDTGCNVWWDDFGFKNVSMVKPDDNTVRFTVTTKSNVEAEVLVQLDTETVDIVTETAWTPKDAAQQDESRQTEE